MASNEIPYTYDVLIRQGEQVHDGANTVGPGIGLLQNTAARILADIRRLNSTDPASPGLKVLWDEAKAAKTAATGVAQAAKKAGRSLAMSCVGALKNKFGRKWSSQWQNAGFTGGTLMVPTDPMVTLQELAAYYGRHPGDEVTVLGVACTKAACEAAVQAISDTMEASNDSNVAAGQAHAAFETGVSALRNRLIGTRSELSQLLADDDPRWLAFGWDMPGQPTAPDEAPSNVVNTPGVAGSGSFYLDWDEPVRADRSRVRITDGTGAVLVNQIVTESEYTVRNLPSGQTVTVVLSGINGDLEGPATDPISVVVP